MDYWKSLEFLRVAMNSSFVGSEMRVTLVDREIRCVIGSEQTVTLKSFNVAGRPATEFISLYELAYEHAYVYNNL